MHAYVYNHLQGTTTPTTPWSGHGLQDTDGIFPNAAIAKKLGEIMGDSDKDISKTPSK